MRDESFMIGRIVASIVFLALAVFVGALLYTDQTPSQLIHSITSRGPGPGDAVSSASVASLSYHYHLEAEGLEPLDYSVEVSIVSRNRSSICFQYRVDRVNQGSPGDARDFMYGFMGYRAENETICTSLAPSEFIAKYYFTSPGKTGTARLTYGRDRGLHGEARVVNGIVREMHLEGVTGGRRVKLDIEVARAAVRPEGATQTSEQASVTRRPAADNNANSLDRIVYRVTWRIGAERSAHEIRHTLTINVLKHEDGRLCYSYKVANVTGDKPETAKMLVEQLYMGKPEDSTICVSTNSTEFDPQHFVYPKRMKGTHRLGSDGEAVVTINGEGVVSRLTAKGYIDAGSNETVPIELELDLEDYR